MTADAARDWNDLFSQNLQLALNHAKLATEAMPPGLMEYEDVLGDCLLGLIETVKRPEAATASRPQLRARAIATMNDVLYKSNFRIDPQFLRRWKDQIDALPPSDSDASAAEAERKTAGARRVATRLQSAGGIPENGFSRATIMSAVLHEMPRLPPAQGLVLSLRFWEELSRVDTATVVGLSVSQTRTLETKALATIKRKLLIRLPGWP